ERWATGKLAASASAAQVVGPGLAGLLVQALTAPSAIAIDAAFYLLYAARELGVAPAVIGLAFAAGGAGGLLGAVLAARLAGRVAATMRVIGWGRLPLGSLVDGPGRQPAW